ncbi:oligoribonuclease [Bacillus sp. FJAT-27225]|uniref:DHH family phosphoesterase n=1 Tax=Bacillus sp. FJAT-27225 TaxID=1743144 RepID=UPI00080C2B14|nr:DHHA1 domain-containing protein [Bacillus sp. FJAT-27225]OCA83286.1 oligoribonuclease [Bacillus sp. FJAT-27225]
MKLFTDIDLDGLGCGLLARLAYGDQADVAYCSHRVLNDRVQHYIANPETAREELYITDLAVNSEVEKKLADRFKKGGHIRLIDHHVTAMHFNEYEWGFVLPEYDSGKKTCATSLFYDHLVKKGALGATKALEEFVDLVRQYDTWEWDENNNTAAKRLNDLFYIMDRSEFEEELLERLKNHPEAFSLSESENFLLDIEDAKIERYIRSKSRQLVQANVDEYCVGIVHAEQYLSELGNALNKLFSHLDMVALLNVGGKKAGFRTIHDEVNVAEFASRFGGGGHPKASGCELGKDIFQKVVVDVFPLQPLKLDADRNELNLRETSYGTYFENRNGDMILIRPLEKGRVEAVSKGNASTEFDSFVAAERDVKRTYSAWLSYDNDLLRRLSEALDIPFEEARQSYKDMLQHLLD